MFNIPNEIAGVLRNSNERRLYREPKQPFSMSYRTL